MTPEKDGLWDRFSQKDKADKKEGEEGSSSTPNAENAAGASAPDVDKILDDLWELKKRYGEEDKPNPPEQAIDESAQIEKQPTVEEVIIPEIKPVTAPVENIRPDTKTVFNSLAIENLRRQKSLSQDAEKVASPETPVKPDKTNMTPAWAHGLNRVKMSSGPEDVAKPFEPEEITTPVRKFGGPQNIEPTGNSPAGNAGENDVQPREVNSSAENENPQDDKAAKAEKHRKIVTGVEVEKNITELRDLVINAPTESRKQTSKRVKKHYTEPSLELNPLVSFIGLVGTICLAIALLMGILGFTSGIGMPGLTGAGLLLIIVYSVANRKNLKILLSARSTRYGTNVVFVILTLLGILTALNGLSYTHYAVYDFSADKLNSLSDQTLQVLNQLSTSGEKVSATVFVPGETEYRRTADTLEDTLAKYSYYLPSMEVEYLDPDVNRQKAEELKFEQPAGVVFKMGDKMEQAIEFRNDSGPWDYESALTSALFRLTGTYKKKVLFLTGHDELGPDNFNDKSHEGDGLLAQTLEQSGYEVGPLSLSSVSGIPDDTSLLFIAAPSKELSTEELGKVKTYVDKGGKVILLMDNMTDAGFNPLLSDYGVTLKKDIIADNQNNLFGLDNLSPVLELSDHPVNAPLTGKGIDVAFIRSSSLEVEPAEKDRMSDVLLMTKPGGSWAEDGTQEEITMDGDEERGPFVMAAMVGKPVVEAIPETADAETATVTPEGAAENKPVEGKTKWGIIMAAGDASFVSNAELDTMGNKDFIINTVGYMTSEEALMFARPHSPEEYMRLTRGQVLIAFLLSTVFMPLIIGAFGIVIWAKRK